MTYAYQAMAYCRNVQKMPSSMPYRPGADSVTYGKRLSTFNEMKYRCQGFSEEELSDQAFGALDRERKKQQDALAVVSSLLLQKNGGLSQAREDQKKYIDAMAALQDPVKIDDGISIVSIHTNKKGKLVIGLMAASIFQRWKTTWCLCATQCSCCRAHSA